MGPEGAWPDGTTTGGLLESAEGAALLAGTGGALPPAGADGEPLRQEATVLGAAGGPLLAGGAEGTAPDGEPLDDEAGTLPLGATTGIDVGGAPHPCVTVTVTVDGWHSAGALGETAGIEAGDIEAGGAEAGGMEAEVSGPLVAGTDGLDSWVAGTEGMEETAGGEEAGPWLDGLEAGVLGA